MDSSKEKIEAQLCEYFEGELDEGQRAEVERHLQTNPQHKALIAEIRQQRKLLQTLPRATVPGELNENLTGQLERSALLSDDDETAEAGVRINRWPQLTAVAAVILLAVGLGVVVYYVLPPAHRNAVVMEDHSGNSAAHRTPALAGRGADAGLPAATEPADKLAEMESLANGVPREGMPSKAAAAAAPAPGLNLGSSAATENKVLASAAPLPSADATAQRLRDLTSGPGLVTSGEVEELQKRMSRTLGGEANAAFNLEPRSSLYLIVQTPDAVATSGQVAAYFKTNNIQYMNYEGPPIELADAAPRSSDAPVKATDADADLSKGGALGGGLSSSTPTGGRGFGLGRAEAVDRTNRGNLGGFGGGGGGAAGPRPQASAADVRRSAASGAAPGETLAQKQENASGVNSPAAAQTQPANERLFRRGLVRGEDVAGGPATSKPYQASSAAKEPTAAPAPAALEARTEVVKAKTEALSDKAAAIVKDELSLATRQAELAPPAANAPQPTGAEAGQQSQSGARGRFVPGDGTWNMRLGGPDGNASRGGVIVARMNRRQASELGLALSREQGQRAELRDLGATAGATAVGKPASPADPASGAPADAAKTPAFAEAAKPATQPSGQSAASGNIQPAIDGLRLTPHPMDEPVDVVIVVKPDTAPPAAARPETDTKK